MQTPGTRAVFAADKIAKVRELALLPEWQLNEPKNRAKLAHYRASLKMLRRVDGHVPLVDRLDAELNQLLARAVAGTPCAGPITSATDSKRSKHRFPATERCPVPAEGGVTVRAIGPLPLPNPQTLRTALNSNGLRRTSVQLEVDPVKRVDLPGT